MMKYSYRHVTHSFIIEKKQNYSKESIVYYLEGKYILFYECVTLCAYANTYLWIQFTHKHFEIDTPTYINILENIFPFLGFFFPFWDNVLPCSLGCPQIAYIDEAGL